MGRKFKVWLDSGANSKSKYEAETSLDELGISDDEWDSMSDDEKEEEMKSVAWERMEWGFQEMQ